MKEMGNLLTAMVTPFDADLQVDYDRAAQLAVKQVEEGSDGLVVSGTTGESPTLSDEEKLQLFRVVKEAVGDATVIAGTGSNDHQHTVELTQAASQTGVDGIMLVGPYYSKPSPEGFYQHFSRAATVTHLPVIVYNVPGRTGKNIDADTVLRLAEDVENIVAVKEASGDIQQISTICAGKPDDFMVYSGDDGMTLPVLAVGGQGVISVVAHVAGPQMAQMIAAFHHKDTQRAGELHHQLLPLFEAAFLPSGNPPCIKRALQICGFDCGGLRLPLVEATETDTQAIRQVCEDLGLV